MAQALRMAAVSARRCQTFIGARHRGRLARKDAPVAIAATARELACLIHTLVTRGEECVDRTVSNLGRRAKQFGYQLVRMLEDPESERGAKSMA
ncbi:MAG: hypothetical protein OXI66_19250 [Boseongicola sp.]|nr:hypothetical protein [Boseongicola sp.]MDE0347895.1 hypothetical protein [Boseongicola sp.]